MSQNREHFGITQGPPFGRLGTTSGNGSPVAEVVPELVDGLSKPRKFIPIISPTKHFTEYMPTLAPDP